MNLWALLAAYFLDRTSKAWAEKNIREGETITVIPNKLYFTRVRNYGFANGVLKEQPGLVLFISIITAFLTLRSAFTELKKAPEAAKLGFSLMLGGGLSNLADRLKNGFVTDFVRFKKGRALIYNVADLFIFAGGIIFAVFSILHKE